LIKRLRFFNVNKLQPERYGVFLLATAIR
jgi:hypothetical protein